MSARQFNLDEAWHSVGSVWGVVGAQGEVKRVRQEMERLAGTVAELKAELAGKAQELVLAIRDKAELEGQVCLIRMHQRSAVHVRFSLQARG